MNKANKFDMISRTVGEELPSCVLSSVYDENIGGFKLEFYGPDDELSTIPSLLDVVVDDLVLVSCAQLKEIRQNVAEYHAYAVHRFTDYIPM